MLKVAFAIESPLYRYAVRRIVDDMEDVKYIGEVSTVEEAIGLSKRRRFDVLVWELITSGMNVFDLFDRIRVLNLKIPVLFIGHCPEEHYIARISKMDGFGYLNTQKSTVEEFVRSLRMVACGRRYISSNDSEIAVDGIKCRSWPDPYEILSTREFQVLRKIAGGKTTREISRDMGLSITTISTYKRRIVKKLNLKTNAEVVRYALNSFLEE